MSVLRRRWEKNWPEVNAALRRGLPPFVLAKHPAPLAGAVPVFWYHTAAAEALEADLRFLSRNGYVTIDADALLDHLTGRRRAPLGAVVLTFDDGARDLYDVVYPLLQAHGHMAVAFISPRFHSPGDRVPAAPGAGDPRRTCTWDELEEMHSAGVVDVQSHSFEHRYFPRWPEPAPLVGVAREYQILPGAALTQEEDLLLAREVIERRLGKVVRHLAFPKFDGTPSAIELGRRLGYRAFWTGVLPGRPLNRPGDDGTGVVRVSGEFLRRLPGVGRAPLGPILYRRYAAAVRSWQERTGR